MKVIDFLLQHAKKLKAMFVLSVFLFVSTFALGRMSVYIGSEMIGIVASDFDMDTKVHKLIIFLFLLFLSSVGSSTLMFFAHVVETSFFIKFQANAYVNISRQILNHSIDFFTKEKTGSIVSRFNKLTNNMFEMFDRFIGFIRIFSTFAITLGIIAFMNIYLASFYFVASVLFIWITTKYRMKIIPEAQREAELESEAVGVLSDAISNASAVKSFANVNHERKYVYGKLKTFLKYWNKASKHRREISYKSNAMYDVVGFSFYLAVFYTWYKFGLSVANIVFIFSSISILMSSIKEFSYNLFGLFRRYGEVKEGISFLYREHGVKDIEGAKNIKITDAEIKFEKVTFKYDGTRNVFSNFSLKIKPRQKIGLVGKSGSGKSSLIKLISRYYDVQKGTISIDGQDVSKVKQNSLRKNIALIPQEPLLFNRTIMENIRYGNIKASDKDVLKAAKKAYCDEFVKALPESYNSKVGEKGVMLSGGERQRIAIARAILQDAPILILDEATSALDSESEIYIQKALKDLMGKKTVIAIAHRLSTLKEMDRIIVFDKGKIVEDGLQSELISKKGVFYNFYKMQSEGFLKIDE